MNKVNIEFVVFYEDIQGNRKFYVKKLVATESPGGDFDTEIATHLSENETISLVREVNGLRKEGKITGKVVVSEG